MKFTAIFALFVLENKAIKVDRITFPSDEQPFEQNYINKNWGKESLAEKKYFDEALKRGPYVPRVKFNNDEDDYMENYNRIVAEEKCKKEARGEGESKVISKECKEAVKTADGHNAF